MVIQGVLCLTVHLPDHQALWGLQCLQECLPPALNLPKELEQLRRMQAAIKTAVNSSGSSNPAEQQQEAPTGSRLLQFQVGARYKRVCGPALTRKTSKMYFNAVMCLECYSAVTRLMGCVPDV